jgi:RNA polymerase sigma factor FliA
VGVNGVLMYTAAQQEERERLVNEHASLVKRIAYHLISRLPPSVQVEDLIQAGTVGLLEAAKKYDASQGASFDTYAGIRVRGAMLDEIRRSDWAPRSVHKNARQITEAIRDVENRTGRSARDAEVAELMGLSLDDYHQVVRDSTSYQVFSFEDITSEAEDKSFWKGGSGGPLEGFTREEFKQALAQGIAGLPEKESLVLSLYYDEELNLKEIGEVLAVSESRVSQIHSQALARLRARLAEWVDLEKESKT